jgi:hypothetical protein
VKTTKHTCGGPVFGKKTAGCPRCDELLSGSAPIVWAWASKENKARRAQFAKFEPCPKCAAGTCGPVCTWGDW